MNLNKDIYTIEKIKDTANAYAKLADIEIKDSTDYWILNFRNCKYNQDITEREFENYLIGLEN